jgi:hypothetical protein
MDEVDRKLTKFIRDLYGPQAQTKRVRWVQLELDNFILSVKAQDSSEKLPSESATTGR